MSTLSVNDSAIDGPRIVHNVVKYEITLWAASQRPHQDLKLVNRDLADIFELKLECKLLAASDSHRPRIPSA